MGIEEYITTIYKPSKFNLIYYGGQSAYGQCGHGGLCAIIMVMASIVVGPEGSIKGSIGPEEDMLTGLLEGLQLLLKGIIIYYDIYLSGYYAIKL